MNRCLALIGCLALAPTFASAQSLAPTGVWMRGDGNARVRIAPCGDKLCAVNVWIGDTSGGEAVGDRLVITLAKVTGETIAGSAYDPKRDLTYAMTMRVQGDTLVTRGCVLGELLCKSVSWSRAN